MKRKRLDRDIWTIISEKRYIQQIIKHEDFYGIVGLLYLDKVSLPTKWTYSREPFDACVTGMKWLQMIKYGENYMITAMISPENKINCWYIDIIDGYGFYEDGVAYWDDLYLDIGICPDGDYVIDDMDELEDALNTGDIIREQFDIAIKTKDMLFDGILKNIQELYGDCLKILDMIENK